MRLLDLIQNDLEKNPDLRGVSVPVLRAVAEGVLRELDEQLGEDVLPSNPCGDEWSRCERCELLYPSVDLSVPPEGAFSECPKCLGDTA